MIRSLSNAITAKINAKASLFLSRSNKRDCSPSLSCYMDGLLVLKKLNMVKSISMVTGQLLGLTLGSFPKLTNGFCPFSIQ